MTRAHLALAGFIRALPDFRGKRRVARLLRRRFLASLPPSEAVRPVRMRDGSRMTLDVRSEAEWWAFYLGRYDHILPAVLKLIPERCAVLDVGANVGLYAIPLGVRVRERGGRCVAFEPVPANYARLVENIRANGLADIVQTLALALGEDHRTITLLLDDNAGAATGNAARVSHAGFEKGQREHRPVTAQMTRLDDCAAELQLGGLPCRFIKVDIEGNEPFFFRGAARFLKAHRPLVLAEVNPFWLAHNGLKAADYFEVFAPEGYSAHLWQRGAWAEVPAVGESFSSGRIQSVLLVPPELLGTIRPRLRKA